jgi:hypothetical protein
LSIELNAQRPTLPSAEQIGQPQIKSAVETWQDAHAAAQTAAQDAYALKVERPLAVEADTVAYADAIEKGKADPGQKLVAAHDEKIANAQRKADALALVRDRAFAAMELTVAEREGEWAPMVAAEVEAAKAAFLDSISGVEQALADLGDALGLSLYLRSGGRKFNPGSAVGQVPLRRSSEGAVAVEAIIAALRSLAEPAPEPEPVAKTPNTRRLVAAA